MQPKAGCYAGTFEIRRGHSVLVVTEFQLETYDRQLLPLVAGERVRLEENCRYSLVIEVNNPSYRVFWGDAQITPGADGVVVIRTGHWVGNTSLTIETPAQTLFVPVTVKPRTEKLSDSLWVSMLQDLEAWVPGITTGAEGGKDGHVGNVGVPAPLIAEALSPLLGSFERAVRALLEQPRRLDVTVQEEVSLHMVRRVDRETLRWVSRHPDLHTFLDPWKIMESNQPLPILPQRRTMDDVDHQVNRYVSWLLRRVEWVLTNTAEGLDAVCKAKPMEETAFWCQLRAANLRRAADHLLKLWRTSFLSRIPKEPLSEAALQVVLDEPPYARVHNIGRLFLNPLFQLNGKGEAPAAAVRPSFSIYELWSFLAINRQLKEMLPAWQWSTKGAKNLLGPLTTGEGVIQKGVGPAGETIEISFNATFSSFFFRLGKRRWSTSAERRPDIIVAYKAPDKEGKWVCLDSKYRVGRSNLGDAFSSVHVYRDSLRYEGYGGRCKAAALLAPSMSPDTKEWFSTEYLQSYDEGIFELTPGVTNSHIAEWLQKVLMD